jgi:4-hydroxy-tetrahydrodipicolinate synthase
MEQARALHYELRVLNEVLFLDTNPIPVKTALALMGKVELEFRSPLTPLTGDALEQLKSALKDYSLIS